jgi:hypothetical protein
MVLECKPQGRSCFRLMQRYRHVLMRENAAKIALKKAANASAKKR